MNDRASPLEAADYWLKALQGMALKPEDLQRAAELAKSNQEILARLYKAAAKAMPEGTLFDLPSARFDFLVGARR